MGYFSQKTQIIIWMLIVIPAILLSLPEKYFKPGLDFYLLSIISLSTGIVLMFFGSYKRIQELKVMKKKELAKLAEDLSSKKESNE